MADQQPNQIPEDRIDRFKAEMMEIGVRDPVAARELALLRLGVALLVIGPIWVVVTYFISHSTRNPLQQRDAMIGAIFGLTLAVAGMALFIRYSLGRFLRFWLARFSFEQQEQATELSSAMKTRSRPLSARPGASAAAPGPAVQAAPASGATDSST